MERIVDIATDGRHLSAHRGFLIVSAEGEEIGRIPLDDVAAVIVHAHGVTWTTNLIVALAQRGALMVLCGANHVPVAVCSPLDGNHEQNARIRAQWSVGKPLAKQLWREIVIAKVRWQGAALQSRGIPGSAFEMLSRRVRSGDVDNVEAQAARRYWPLLMGPEFRRDRKGDGLNGMLNYGYTVLRSLLARSVVAAGLHPSIGIHHANRGNAFALADDLVEPFRSLVDVLVVQLRDRGCTEVTPETKRAFAGLIALDLQGESGTTTVAGAAGKLAQSLARCFETGNVSNLVLPRPPAPMELWNLTVSECAPPG